MNTIIHLPEYTFILGKHRDKNVIFIKFDYDTEKINAIKKLVGIKWSATNRSWYVQDNHTYRDLFNISKKPLLDAYESFSPYHKSLLAQQLQMIELKGYGANTAKTYVHEFSRFLYGIGNLKVENLTQEHIQAYFHDLIKNKRLSENTIHSRINAVKFYYENILKREKIKIEFIRPKKKIILPKVISEERVWQIILQTQNLKHRAVLMTAYSAGLRVSEIINLKISDIDKDRMQILIQCAKGKKDRLVPLSKILLIVLREYYVQFKPKKYLFEGQFGGKYSARSAQAIFKDAIRELNLPEHYSFHSLRHSTATHLLENGIDIKYIQTLLGHNDIKTTAIYASVSKEKFNQIESPLDMLYRQHYPPKILPTCNTL